MFKKLFPSVVALLGLYVLVLVLPIADVCLHELLSLCEEVTQGGVALIDRVLRHSLLPASLTLH